MELQWEHRNWEYLRCHTRQVQNVEQTQEIRLPEGMPDIGRVLCAWGQCMVRSKEWRNEGMTVGGVVQVWVLYAPEDGSEPRSVEAQLPYSGKWNFQDSKREGYIRVNAQLCHVDGRALSSRKLMVRASVSLLAEAMEMTEAAVYAPEDAPQTLQMLKKTYPAVLPREAGEKLFTVEETITPASAPRKILACRVQPVIGEQAAAGGRVVFRGECRVQLVYMDENDQICSDSHVLPFAQMAELDRDYDKDATAMVVPAVSGVEHTVSAGTVSVSCSLIGQYVIFQRWMLEAIEDVYCPHCPVEANVQPLQLPMVLESRSEQMELMAEAEAAAERLVDVTCLQEQPTIWRDGEQVVLEAPCTFQALYYDDEGNLRSLTKSGSGRLQLPAAPECTMTACITACETPQAMMMGQNLRLETRNTLQLCTRADQQIPMISGVSMGTAMRDPSAPSLILQRMGEGGLWELAKNCDSTVEAILKANPAAGEPQPGQMLLIPVM